jgi:RNA polymerase sigma factor (TIGR02999 family)
MAAQGERQLVHQEVIRLGPRAAGAPARAAATTAKVVFEKGVIADALAVQSIAPERDLFLEPAPGATDASAQAPRSLATLDMGAGAPVRWTMGDITTLIERARAGDLAAFDALFAALYPELRRIAHARLDHGLRDTLESTTMLVHECYLKLREAERLTPADRAHFLAYSATVMRSIVIDAARRRATERQGGQAPHQELTDELAERIAAKPADAADEILELDQALAELAVLDDRLARVVEMRYFGGMNDSEIGAALDLHERTVRRDWEKARLLLASALRG